MVRLSSRLWLGIAAALALAILGYALVRPRASLSTTPAKAAQVTASTASSISSVADWVMEGANPARTRSRSESVSLPINRQYALRIAEDKGVGSPVAIASNTIFVDSEHRLRALDLRSGQERWSFSEVGQYVSPAVAGDTVFIRAESANKGQIFALDLRTGAQRWAFTPRRISDSSSSYWGGHLTSPVVADGVVFVGAGTQLYALDAATGAQRWEYTAQDLVASSATVGDGRIFISDLNHVYAIDQHTGALAWKTPTQFAIYFSPIVSNGAVFLTNGDNILALSTSDGAKRWETGIGGEILRPGAVQGSRIFVKSTSTLYALDLTTGKELWQYNHPGFVSFPAVAGTQLFTVAGSEGQAGLLVLDVETGKPILTQPVARLASAAPVIAGQTLYVRTTDGQVVGLFN